MFTLVRTNAGVDALLVYDNSRPARGCKAALRAFIGPLTSVFIGNVFLESAFVCRLEGTQRTPEGFLISVVLLPVCDEVYSCRRYKSTVLAFQRTFVIMCA